MTVLAVLSMSPKAETAGGNFVQRAIPTLPARCHAGFVASCNAVAISTRGGNRIRWIGKRRHKNIERSNRRRGLRCNRLAGMTLRPARNPSTTCRSNNRTDQQRVCRPPPGPNRAPEAPSERQPRAFLRLRRVRSRLACQTRSVLLSKTGPGFACKAAEPVPVMQNFHRPGMRSA